MNSFIRRFQNYVFQRKLFERGAWIVIGCSGGPDSVCLVKVLDALKEKYNLKLKLVHINYGLRGKDSDGDEKFVRDFAEKLNLPLEVFHYERKNVKENLESNLRDFRYNIFEDVRKKEDYDWIAVAHNKDDQVETVLMNLLRGSGLKGLGGMSPKREKIIRPLVDFERKDIIHFLKQSKQKYRIDKTNFETEFFRNKIRKKLVPLLEKQYNPRTKDRIFALAENLRSDFDLVEEITNKEYNRIVVEEKGKFLLSVKKIGRVSVAVRKHLFRKVMKRLKGNLQNVSLANFLEFEKIVQSSKSKSQIIRIGRVVIKRNGDSIYFT